MFPGFDERLTLICEKTSNKLQIIQQQINELRQESSKLSQESIASLCKEYGKDIVFEALKDDQKDSRKYDLLKHMIERGYIDQHYHLYIYHHRDGVLNSEDLSYLKQIKRGTEVKADYVPTNIREFIKYFDNHDYSRKSFFNISIINEMMANVAQDEPIRIHIKSAYTDESELLDLFLSYREQFLYVQRFAWTIYIQREHFIGRIIASELSNSKKLSFIDNIIQYSCSESFQLSKEQQVLSKYLSTQQKIVELASMYAEPQAYLDKLEKIGVCFEEIHKSENLKEVMQIIFKKGMYHLNYLNFRAVVKACFDINPNPNQGGKLVLDELYAISDEVFKELLTENEDFIADQVVNENFVVTGSNVFTTLLSSTQIDMEIKEFIIKIVNLKVQNLDHININGDKAQEVKGEVIQKLIVEKKLSYDELVQKQLIDSIGLVNSSFVAGYFEEVISNNVLAKTIGDSGVKVLLKLLFDENAPTCAEQFIDIYQLEFDDFLISISPEETLKKYIEQNRVAMNRANYLQIHSINVDISLLLLSQDYETVDYTPEGINFTQDELYRAIGGNFNTGFKYFLIMNYSQFLSDNEDNESLIDLALMTDDTESEQLVLSTKIIKMLLQNIPADKKERKLALFNRQFHNLTKLEAIELLRLIDEDVHAAISENKKPKVKKTQEMKKMLELLQKHQIISSYTEIFGDLKINPKRN